MNNHDISSNLSVPNCNLRCYDQGGIFNQNTEPRRKSGYAIINPSVFQNKKIATDFSKNDCPCAECKNSVVSADPRLIDVPRAFSMSLDTVPFDSGRPLSEVYDRNLAGYGKNYRNYSDINTGQIVYYIDHALEDAFFSPNFVNNSNVIGYNYKDPMGGMKPHYDRTPNQCVNPLNVTRQDNGGNCLSWMRDSQETREDLMSKQMSTINQSRFMPRWT